MYICICHAVTDRQIVSAVEQRQVSNLRDLATQMRVGTTCGRCARCARELLNNCCKKVTADEPICSAA